MIKIIYDNRSNKFRLPVEILPNGRKFPHHFLSTPIDNAIEMAARSCYESYATEKSRDSTAFHKHINEVGHSSVQRHCYLTFKISVDQNNIVDVYRSLNGKGGLRPGVFSSEERGIGESTFYVSANICSIKEWNKFSVDPTDRINQELFAALAASAKQNAPLACSDLQVQNLEGDLHLHIEECKPISDTELWVSIYIADISRNAIYEMIRHTTQYAVSQRSTRYVDEDTSDFIDHPVYRRYKNKLSQSLVGGLPEWEGNEILSEYSGNSRFLYRKAVDCFTDCLIQDGADKFTARKQARGAARGFLPSCLSTELVFSASLWQWKEIIRQRASEHADEEIRELAIAVEGVLRTEFPNAF